MAPLACDNSATPPPDGGGAETSADTGVDNMSLDSMDDMSSDGAETSAPPDTDSGGPSGDSSSGEAGGDDGGTMCAPIEDLVEGCVKADDGTLVMAPFASAVTLTQIDDVAPGACRSTTFDNARNPVPSSALSKRLTLTTADMRVWTVVLRMPDLPHNLLQVGDAFDLSLDAFEDINGFSRGWNQTLVLARGNSPLVFAATLNRYDIAARPDLSALGVQFEDDGLLCRWPPFPPTCLVREHRLRIVHAGESVVTRAGQSGRVGGLSFAVDAFFDRKSGSGGCDAKGFTQVAGFFAPAR